MRIDVFHDVVCPWCRIGKQHLQMALAQWGGTADVQYHTFFLNDSLPPDGADFHTVMMQKGGGHITDLEQFFAAPREAGQRAGLTFNFERITRAPNTLRAHRLIALTPTDQQPAMIDALYRAYFEEGLDVGDLDVLVSVGAALGLPADALREQLRGDAAAAEVRAAAAHAQRLGVRGVPLFVFENTLALSGAQPPAILLQAIHQTEALTL